MQYAQCFIDSFLTCFGCEVSLLEQHLFSLPVQWGGLGLMMPCGSATSNFSASQHATQVLGTAIKGVSIFELDNHELMLLEVYKIIDATTDSADETLVADFSIRGVWLPQAEGMCDVHVIPL